MLTCRYEMQPETSQGKERMNSPRHFIALKDPLFVINNRTLQYVLID